MRIHIVSMSIGNGHNEAARVLAKHAVKEGDDVRIYHPLEMYSERLFKQLKRMYKWMVLYHPAYWRKLIKKKHPFLYDYFPFLLRSTYEQVMDADMILSVHPLLSAIGGEIKSITNASVPLFHVATDFWQSPLLHHPAINVRFVPNDHAMSFFHKQARIYSTGMPIDMKEKPLSKKEYCFKYGWNPSKPIVIVSGGGEKMFPFQEVERVLATLSIPSTVLFIGAVRRKMEKRTRKGHDMYLYPFMKEFKEFLKIADVLISKAGGMTAAEAIAAEIPTIFYKPLPGHEEGNAQLLRQKKIAYWAKNVNELYYWTERLLHHPSERMKLKKRMKVFIPSHGAERIIALSKYDASLAMFHPQISRPKTDSDKKNYQQGPIS